MPVRPRGVDLYHPPTMCVPSRRRPGPRREMAPDPTRDPDRRPGAGPAGRVPSRGVGRWVPWIVLGLLAAVLGAATLLDGGGGGGRDLDYGTFLRLVADDRVD